MTSLSYTPPALQAGRPGPVRRRHVFYVPGYDPEGCTRYRQLFVRELMRRAKRFGEGKRALSTAETSADGLVQSWSVGAHPPTQGAETGYDVLLWDDLVRRDFKRSRVVSIGLLLAGTLHMLCTGTLIRLYRLSWKYGNVIFYPFVMLVLLTLVSVCLGTLVHAHLGGWFDHGLNLPHWLSLTAGVAAGIAWIVALERVLNRIFFWQLLNDWVFNWQHGQGLRPDYEARLEAFTGLVLTRIAALAASAEPPDEVLIVGHSSGALTAVEVAARILARNAGLGIDGPSLGLVTLGSGVPLVALQPNAHRLRAEIAGLVASSRLVWLDVQAPQDWMNFPGFNPLRDIPLDLRGEAPANPLIRSACFREIMSPERYARVHRSPFRTHFQFLLANDRPGAYDFFAMTLGPQRLRERVLAPIVETMPEACPEAATATAV
ncbi:MULTISPECIES: alpha/beta hydrolase [Methylobacterium]|uniref:alpha/beta hydrolase n=4 Tax=Pseudomonadota TaxID=1224 RepID=UPI000CB06E03|nr:MULTISPECIES: alpha/beta hydrolase [Methylobacterium]PIU11883.1 MAG: hypothetical protein COT28_17750 [Methylobacterium sp. CG08_land_8_20_14_0_20_71_15]